MQEGANSSRIGAGAPQLDARRMEANAAILSVLRYMTGDLSLTEAASRAELPRSVVAELSSEFAGFLLPRALRSIRHARGLANHSDGRERAITNR
ncbi:hypothetical protein AVW09_11230 [Microbacterium sp. T32]|nr:hypothetical protein AVW09_11230 [Microbacterium sp. T32]